MNVLKSGGFLFSVPKGQFNKVESKFEFVHTHSRNEP